MGITVERATLEDLPERLGLMRGYSTFYGARAAEADLRAMAEAFSADTAGGTQLVARDDGALVGFATVLWSWDTTTATRLAVMEDLFVVPDARGRGVGRALLSACADLARRRGCPALAWETAPDNHVAQRLYDALGAERSSWLAYRLPLD